MLIKFIRNWIRWKKEHKKPEPILEQPQLFIFISLKFPISRQSDERQKNCAIKVSAELSYFSILTWITRCEGAFYNLDIFILLPAYSDLRIVEGDMELRQIIGFASNYLIRFNEIF